MNTSLSITIASLVGIVFGVYGLGLSTMSIVWDLLDNDKVSGRSTLLLITSLSLIIIGGIFSGNLS